MISSQKRLARRRLTRWSIVFTLKPSNRRCSSASTGKRKKGNGLQRDTGENSMLEQFATAYDIHPWLRRAIWGVLGIAGIFLFWFSGGFPPRAWRLLFEVIPHI